MFAGETCLAKHLNVSPKLRPQVTKKQTSWKKKKKELQISHKSEKKPRQFNGVLSPVRDNWYCYSVVFENVRFQPSTHNKYGKAEFSKFGSPGYVLKEAQPAKKTTNKQTNKQILSSLKKKAKDTYTCGQELTRINASEKDNKYTDSKEKYSS